MNLTSVHGSVLDHPGLYCPLDDPLCVTFTVAVETAIPPVPGHAGPLVCEVIGYGPLAEYVDGEAVVDVEEAAGVDLSGLTPPW